MQNLGAGKIITIHLRSFDPLPEVLGCNDPNLEGLTYMSMFVEWLDPLLFK